MRIAASALAFAGLAACHPAAAPLDALAPTAQVAQAPADAAPAGATKPVSFDALSPSAEATTGPISLTSLGQAGADDAPGMRLVAANGSVYQTALLPDAAEQAKDVKWSDIFQTPISFDPKAPADVPSVDLHLVTSEVISPKAAKGGFCGREKTYAFAMALPITTPKGEVMTIAAFKGSSWPPKSAGDYCGSFTYAAPH